MESTLDTFFKGVSGVARQTAWKKILHWRSQIDFITQAASSPSSASNRTIRSTGTGTTLDSTAEENIVNWVCQLRSDGVPVSRLLLSCKALEVAKDLGLSTAQFKASPSWVDGFFRRWKMSMRAKTRSGQSNLAQGEAARNEFASRIQSVIQEHAIEDIYNADQTGINYEYLPKETINAKGAKTVWIKCAGHEKDRMTAVLLADSKGNKYPPFLVLKSMESKVKKVVQENLTTRNGFGRQVWQEIEELHERHPSRIYGNPTAWWNSTISIAFLTYHFGHRQGKNNKHVLLLWDDFSAHFTEDVVAYAKTVNVVLEKIPPTFTWICQPADVAWMKPLKACLRRKWVDHLRAEIDGSKMSDEPFKLRAPDRFELVDWVNDAWDSIARRTIISGFEKCHVIQNANQETQDVYHRKGIDFQDDETLDSSNHDDITAVANVLESLLQMDVVNVEILALADEQEELALSDLDASLVDGQTSKP
ncbi:hypothetical protein DYB35_002129 [Aphanomyces astaci]|uniref:HTH CENPB-type domain-containing protein n=1 Tax=Aphanomyces astaci TaxID=112090 RepID=A0A3R7DXX1_APHAT|nr:hypothetical protein DYB35_002129 [Aphanomyces astaci]